MNRKGLRNSRVLRSQTISEAAVIIAVLTFVSKIFGYLREILVANYFGATAKTDAFLVALLIPNMILGLFSAGLSTTIIPIFTEKKKEDETKGKLFVNQVFMISSTVLVIVSIFIVLFSGFFIKLVAYGFKGESLLMAERFIKLLTIFGFFNCISGLFTGLLQAERQFLVPILSSVVGNAMVPLSLFVLTPFLDIGSWIVGQIAFGAVQFFAMFIFLRKRWGFFKSFRVKGIMWGEVFNFYKLTLPIILTSGAGVLYQIVDKSVASSLQAGSISALNFAQRVYLIPYGLIGVSLAVSVFPTFSSFAVNRDTEGYSNVFEKSLIFLMYIMIPLSSFFVIFAQPIVKLLFERGAFDVSATTLTSLCVSMYAVSLFFLSLNDIFHRVFFSYKDTRTPMYISLFTVVLNIVLDILLGRLMGAAGIALATTLVTLSATVVHLFILMRRHYVGNLKRRQLFVEIAKVLIGTSIVIVISVFIKARVNFNLGFLPLLLRMVLISIVLLVVYTASTFILHSRGLGIMREEVTKILKNFWKTLFGY